MAITEDQEPGASPDRHRARGGDELGTMTLFEHLAELRRRLVFCVLAVVVATVVIWFFYNSLLDFMRSPYCSFVRHHPQKSISNCSFVTTGPLEGFTTRLKVCGYTAVAAAAPVWLYHLLRFITPGLHKHEKRYVLPFVAAAIVLFAAGVTAAILVFPKAINWLISVSGRGVVPLFAPSQYFTLYALMCLIFGAVFLYPLVVVFLELTGAVPSARWRTWRRP
ncbi:MAG: twin-arginine translocase subunit TatC, partial [Acidimicrobiales bacterium]